MTPTIAGVMGQTGTYGATIPRIIGTTMTAPLITWLNGIRKAGSAKKGTKKAGVNTYNACATLLLGHNPIQHALRVIASNVGLGLNNSKVSTGYGVTSFTISDSNFYALVGVTATISKSASFIDYGAQRTISYSGSYELPLWNLAMQGPDPINPSGYRNEPWTYFCQPGSATITQLPVLSGPSTLNFYYASTVRTGFGAGEFPLPFVLNCDFESSLGDGPEYTDYKDFTAQQIIYPMFAGAGSFNFDIGMGAAPQMRIEVMGAYTLYPDPVASSVEPRADADFADMVEDIFKMGQTQAAMTSSGTGTATASSPIQAGVSCWEFPGTVQKKFWTRTVNGVFTGNLPFDIPTTQGNILVATIASNGISTPSVTDTLGNTWTSVIGTPGVGFFYAKASSSGFNAIHFTNFTSDSDIQIYEIGGCDTVDGAVLSTASGLTVPQGSITTTSNLGQQGYVMAWVFAGVGAGVGTGVASLWNPLIPATAQGGNYYGFGNQWTYSEYRVTNYPGTYTFTGDQATSSWFVVMLALKNAVAPSFPKPFGNILDDSSLNQCRLQCRANGLWGSLVMNSQQSASKWLEDLYTCMDAWPVWSGFKLKSVPLSEVSIIGHGATYVAATTAGPVVNLSDLSGDFIGSSESPLIDIQRKAVVDRPSLLRIQNPDANNNYNQTSISQPDVMGLTLYGLRYASPRVLNMIQHVSVARMVLGIMTRRQNYLLNTYKFKLVGKYKLLEAGDLITISDQQLGLAKLPVRLTSISESNKYELDCEAEDFIYGLHDPTPLPTTESQGNSVPGVTTNVPLPVNTPVFFEPPLALTGDTQDQLWVAVSDPDTTYGGSQVYVSVDGGVSYNTLEGLDGTTLVQGSATTGVTTGTWPQALDPDSTNNLSVNLTESLGSLEQYSTVQENNFSYPCYVAGGGGVFPFELMTYGSALLTSSYNYTLQATGGGGGAGIEDIMDWVMIGNPLRTTHHLSGTGVYAANWLDADGLKFWLIKNTAGNPWDINTYDTSFIYHYITENADTDEPGGSHWGSATAFKRHITPLPVMPRFYNPSGGPVTITTAGSNPFTRTLSCESDGEPLINLGTVVETTSGPTVMSFGGDVGTQPTIINTHTYGSQREQFFYCKGLGLVQWQHANLVGGSYVVDQTTLHNKIVAGGCPTPNFPCYSSIPGPGFSGSWIGGVPGAGGNIAIPTGSGGGGNFLRRGIFGTWASSVLPNTGPAHTTNSRFAFVGSGASGIFKTRVPSAWTGQTLHFKFVQFNTFGAGQGSLTSSTDYTYTVIGTGNTGGTGGGTGGSGGGGSSSYTINPTNPLTNPTSTSIAMAAVTATFSPSNLQTHYNARTFTISAPSSPTTYYVTVYDPALTGDTGSSTNLTSFCSTSQVTAHVGTAGYIYMGFITALPAGGGNAGGGGTNPGGGSGTATFGIISATVGKPAANQLVAIYTAFSVEVFPANFGSPNPSYGSVGVNPTSTATYTVNKNGSSVGSIAIATGGGFTFTSSGFTLSPNDRLTVVAPSSQDATLADVSITLVGTR